MYPGGRGHVIDSFYGILIAKNIMGEDHLMTHICAITERHLWVSVWDNFQSKLQEDLNGYWDE